MLKALKVTMIIWGILGILWGLALIFIPHELGTMLGYEQGGPEYVAKYISYFLASLGIAMVAPSIFIIAAARDPIRHIYWVKFAILWAILVIVINLYSIVRGYVDFGKVGMDIILQAVFLAAFLVFYPWRAPSSADSADR